MLTRREHFKQIIKGTWVDEDLKQFASLLLKSCLIFAILPIATHFFPEYFLCFCALVIILALFEGTYQINKWNTQGGQHAPK